MGLSPVGALGRTASRLKAAFALVFFALVTLAVLAPQDARAQQKPALTATPGVGSVTLNWTRTGNTGFGYWVYRQGVTGGGYGDWIDIPGGATIRTHTVTGLTPGTSYTFQVARAEGTGLNFSVFASGGGYSNGATATPTAATSTKTITLSATSTSITEGNSGFTDVTVTVTLGEAAPAADPDLGIFSLSLISASPPGTATGSSKGANPCTAPLNPADTDWCHPDGANISIAEGETMGTKKVRILADTRDEPNETIKLVSSAAHPGWTDGSLTLTITDDDPPTTAVPAATAGLGSDAGDRKVTLIWEAVRDSNPAITKWQYQQKTGLAAYGAWTDISNSAEGEPNNGRYVVTGLSNGTEYKFKVRAVNSSGNGVVSNETTATPTGSKTITLTTDQPNNRITEGDTERKNIVLTVTLSEDAPDEFLVSISYGGGIGTLVGNDNGGSDNCSNPTPATADICFPGGPSASSLPIESGQRTATRTVGILPDTLEEGDEYFSMRASTSTGGWSGDSILITIVDNDGTTAKPAKPTGLSAEAGNGQVELTWTDPEDDSITGYQVQQRKGSAAWGSWTDISGSDADTTNHTVTGLDNDSAYRFRIRAQNGGGNSAASAVVRATPAEPATAPAKPTGLGATKGDTWVYLTWTDPGDASITRWEYRQKAGTGNYGSWMRMTGSGAATVKHQIPGLKNGTVYAFRIRAVNGNGNGAASEEVTATPNPPVAPVLTAATSTTNRNLTLTWTHAGSTAVDYIDGGGASAVWWQTGHRLKGSTTWTAYGGNVSAARGNSRRTSSALLGSAAAYPNGASVEVAIRASGDSLLLGRSDVKGPWSNERTVTFMNTDTNALTITGAPVTVAPGSTAVYRVALTKAYAGTLSVKSDDTDTATVSPPNLTFTADNYSTAQDVTVTGVKNGTATINHAFRLTGATVDAIPDAGTVDVTVADAPGVTVSTAALTVAEGGSGAYTMRLNTAPSSDVTIMVDGASGDVTVANATLTFTTVNWNMPQTVTVNAGTDTDTTPDAAVTLTHSASGGGYASVSIASVVVSVTESGVVPAKPTGLAAAAGDGSVTLSWTDAGNPTITKWQYRRKAGGGAWGDWTDIGGSGASTTSYEVSGLTNGTAYQFEVRAVNGAGNGAGPDAPVSATPTGATPPSTPPGTTPTPPAAVGSGSVRVTPAALTVEEGGTGSYTVVLGAEPAGTVTVTVGGASGEVTAVPRRLSFTVSNWSEPQRVTVSAARDADTADDRATLTHGARGGGYDSVSIASVVVRVRDTTPVLSLETDPAAVSEGEDIRLVVTSDRALTGNLTVSLTLAARDGSGFDAEDLPGGLGPRSLDAVFGATASRRGVVMIPTRTDGEVEGRESYGIRLNAAEGYAVGVDAEAEGVLEEGSSEGADRVNRAILPQVAAMALSQTLEAVTRRIEAVSDGGVGGAVRFGAAPGKAVEEEWVGLGDPGQQGPGLREMLDGASFALPLGASGAGGAAVPALWGVGEWRSLSGSERDLSWEGGLWSGYLGADVRVRPDLLAGAAVSYAKGKVDAVSKRGDRTKSRHESRVVSVNPYLAWLRADGTTLWASAGYGRGEVRIAEAGAAARTADLSQWSGAAGGRGVLMEDTEIIAGGTTRVAVKGEGSLVQLGTEAGDGLTELTVKASRLRLMLEGSWEHRVGGDATLTPALEVGVRHDDGDVGQGGGVEVGAGVIWRDPGARLTAELRARMLAVHERDRKEWGVSALVILDPGADGRGSYLSFGPAHGRTESGVGGLFDYGPATDSGAGAEESRLEAELGHGIGIAGPALLTPYAGLSLAESGERTLRLGARYRLGSGVALGIEGTSRPWTNGEQSLMLRGALRW